MTAFFSWSLEPEQHGLIAVLRFNRPDVGNALCEDMILDLNEYLGSLPSDIRAIVLTGEGDDFCTGFRSAPTCRISEDVVELSRLWHRLLQNLKFGSCPVVAALHGSVVGAGLEMASAAHVRIADQATAYRLAAGTDGAFRGWSEGAYTAQVVGTGRAVEMMLTGRTVYATEGQSVGLSHEVVAPGRSLEQALRRARAIAANPPNMNLFLVQAFPRISEQPWNGSAMAEILVARTMSDKEGKDEAQIE